MTDYPINYLQRQSKLQWDAASTTQQNTSKTDGQYPGIKPRNSKTK